MTTNCNLELRLFPFSDPNHHPPTLEEKEISDEQSQQLTIFYDGRVCVCDVTELQARAILLVASREMGEKQTTPNGSGSEVGIPPNLPSQVRRSVAGGGLSMKRSIQRFLQKRKHRVQSNTPYNH